MGLLRLMTNSAGVIRVNQNPAPSPRNTRVWVFDLLLILVLLAGAYLRFSGLDWGEYQYLHPDERFLLQVGSGITPTKCLDPNFSTFDCPEGQKRWLSLGEYFDTASSTLNPNNTGAPFYVYGTLPMFITRFVVEWVFGHSGYEEMTQIGRALSALADLLAVFLVYIVAARLYNRRVALLAAAFSAFAVLQIQQSHFFTMDTFVNLFMLLAFYFAVRVVTVRPEATDTSMVKHPWLLPSLGFGLALGMAVASKLNAAPIAGVLPLAMAIALLPLQAEERERHAYRAVAFLVIAAVVSLVVFRILQPYAFTGPGFFDVKLNPQWMSTIRELRALTGRDADYPPAMQWARRPVWFSAQNLILWGLGLPLGILAFAGFIWVGWRLLKSFDLRNGQAGIWQRHALIFLWTGAYFVWQSLSNNPTLRYQLPIYPQLAIFAAWALVALYDFKRGAQPSDSEIGVSKPSSLFPALSVILGALVLSATAAYAFAFTQIYTRPITRLEASRWIYRNIPGPINLSIQTGDGVFNQPLPFYYGGVVSASQPFSTHFVARAGGELSEIHFPHVQDLQAASGVETLQVSIFAPANGEQPLAAGTVPVDPPFGDGLGDPYTLRLVPPVRLVEGETYLIRLELAPGSLGMLTFNGTGIANEGDWDDPAPWRMEGYDPFGGVYPLDMNLNMYTDDNPEKLGRFARILDQAEYVVITSSRQWGSLPRIPERYPMTTVYYRELIGCPDERTIEWCYNVAQPGDFQGRLGFELIKTFQSNPRLGPFEINDQFAEEAFTVYDHPKVFIFKKTAGFDLQAVRQALGSVDFEKIVRKPPGHYESKPSSLLLPAGRWEAQQRGGDWSRLFDTGSPLNRFPFVGAGVWYLSLLALGLFTYPLLRQALPGLPDGGYPLARIAGLLLLSWLVWIAGSAGIAFTRPTIAAALGLIAAGGVALAYLQREALRRELRERARYFLLVEVLFLAFFVFDLLIRYGNPDLWHPWYGGEKPMDFAYLNAVLKSTTFPPYDPWYAGGYLNYYYYGFVFVGVLIKFLGIVPAIAYNLILPTIFAMMAMGAFSLVWNLVSAIQERQSPELDARRPGVFGLPLYSGLASALGMAVLGNLGTVRMIWQGYQKLAAPGGVIDEAGFLTRLSWAFQGFMQVLGGENLPYSIAHWYWNPSRVIPAPGEVEPINEFPFFTVLYGDPHAHLFALPLTLLALGFVVSVVLSCARWRTALGAGLGFFFGALAIGALRPTNTWDFYPYLALGSIALGYALVTYYRPSPLLLRFVPALREFSLPSLRLAAGLAGVALLAGLSFLLFQPFAQWYGQGYNEVTLWEGTRTPMSSYLTHWGLFLFIIVSWMVYETIDWMASTPVSALRKLEPYRGLIITALALLVGGVAGLIFLKVRIAWLVLPLAAWAAVLILRPGQPDGKRLVLFLIGTGLTLTLMVELIVLKGDIARMNTVFKFYLQVWTLFAVSAAAGFGWILANFRKWDTRLSLAWEIGLTLLVAGAALYTLLATTAKVKDRFVETAPHTLDGMLYMNYATYDWEGPMDLAQDYRAIRWLQENVQGSPVTVEGNLGPDLYRWGSRISVYTGLPGVVGWEWHQQQQRAINPGSWVLQRVSEVDQFYTTTDLAQAASFLEKYDVRYIVVGQLEYNHYPGPGLEKFPNADGLLWRLVYQDGRTSIYEVIQTTG